MVNDGPAFSLDLIKTLIRQGKFRFTERALSDCRRDFGYRQETAALFILAKIKSGHFLKTQESEEKPGLFHDVYKRKIYRHPRPVEAYIKFRVLGEHPEQKVVVISFHKSDQ